MRNGILQGWISGDLASRELFPKHFRRVKYKTDSNGNLLLDENGNRIEIKYTECRFCGDEVDENTCRGKKHDECSVCWELGHEQTCRRCHETN